MSLFNEDELEKIKEVFDDIYGDDRRLAELELSELRRDFAKLCGFLPQDECMKLRVIVHGLTQLLHESADAPLFPTSWPSGMDVLMFSKNHLDAFERIRNHRFLSQTLFEPIRRAHTFMQELWQIIDLAVDAREAEIAKEIASEAAKQ